MVQPSKHQRVLIVAMYTEIDVQKMIKWSLTIAGHDWILNSRTWIVKCYLLHGLEFDLHTSTPTSDVFPDIFLRSFSSRKGSLKLAFPSWIVSSLSSCDSCLPKIMDWSSFFITIYSSPGSLSESSVLVTFPVRFWQRPRILFFMITWR